MSHRDLVLPTLLVLSALSACAVAPTRDPSAIELGARVTCQESIVQILGERLRVERLRRGGDDSAASLRDLFRDSTGLVVVHIDENAHASLHVDGKRFDGEMLMGKGTFRDSSTVKNGVMMAFELPTESFTKLKARMDAELQKEATTCMAGVCKMLRDGADVEVPENDILPILTLKGLLSHNYKDGSGNLIPVRIFQLGEVGPEHIRGTLLRRQKETATYIFRDPQQASGALSLLIVTATIAVSSAPEGEKAGAN